MQGSPLNNSKASNRRTSAIAPAHIEDLTLQISILVWKQAEHFGQWLMGSFHMGSLHIGMTNLSCAILVL